MEGRVRTFTDLFCSAHLTDGKEEEEEEDWLKSSAVLKLARLDYAGSSSNRRRRKEKKRKEVGKNRSQKSLSIVCHVDM